MSNRQKTEGDRYNAAECSGVEWRNGTKQNGMKLYYNYGSPTERRKRVCEDEGEEAQ